MFEQILKKLKTEYKNLGLSEEYLKVVAKRLAKTVSEESEIENAVAEVEDELKYQQKQDDLLRTLKSQLEKVKEGEKKEELNPDKKDDGGKDKREEPKEDVPAWAKALMESNRALSDKLDGLEREKLNQTNEQKLISKLKELGVNENFYMHQIAGKTFENDEEIEAFASSIKENETAFIQSFNNSKLGNTEPPILGSGSVEGQVSADVQAFVGTFKKE